MAMNPRLLASDLCRRKQIDANANETERRALDRFRASPPARDRPPMSNDPCRLENTEACSEDRSPEDGVHAHGRLQLLIKNMQQPSRASQNWSTGVCQYLSSERPTDFDKSSGSGGSRVK